MARVVLGYHVLHKHSGVTRLPLPLIRQRVARLQRLEQLVLLNTHEAVTKPVGAVVVIERMPLVFAQVGAKCAGSIQYLVGPHLRYYGLHGTVVVTRPAEAVALAVRTG